MQKHNDWLCIAQDDLKAANKLIEGDYPVLAPAIYHAQQCAEKALKSYLSFKNIEIKKTHDLVGLVKLCNKFDNDFEILIDLAVQLNPYSTKSRYPEDCLFVPDISLVKQSIKEAEQILNFVINKIQN